MKIPTTPLLPNKLAITQTVETTYGPARIELACYAKSNFLAVDIVSAQDDPATGTFDGEPIMTLSFNPDVPVADPGHGAFFAKTWGGNELLTPVLLASGLFEQTGERARAGHANGEVWRLKGVALEQFNEATGVAVSAVAEDHGEAAINNMKQHVQKLEKVVMEMREMLAAGAKPAPASAPQKKVSRISVHAYCLDDQFEGMINARGVTITDRTRAPYDVTFEGARADLESMLREHWRTNDEEMDVMINSIREVELSQAEIDNQVYVAALLKVVEVAPYHIGYIADTALIQTGVRVLPKQSTPGSAPSPDL